MADVSAELVTELATVLATVLAVEPAVVDDVVEPADVTVALGSLDCVDSLGDEEPVMGALDDEVVPEPEVVVIGNTLMHVTFQLLAARSTASEHWPELVGPVQLYLHASPSLQSVVLDGPGGMSAVGQNGAIDFGGRHTTVELPPIAVSSQSFCATAPAAKKREFSVFHFFFGEGELTGPHV